MPLSSLPERQLLLYCILATDYFHSRNLLRPLATRTSTCGIEIKTVLLSNHKENFHFLLSQVLQEEAGEGDGGSGGGFLCYYENQMNTLPDNN